MLADDLDDALRSDLYGLAVAETGSRAVLKMKANKVPVTEAVRPQFQLRC